MRRWVVSRSGSAAARVRRHSSRSSVTFVVLANVRSRFWADGSAAAAGAIASTWADDSAPPRNASQIDGSAETCRDVSKARFATLVVVPLTLARCSAAERAPVPFQSRASSTRAASNVFAFVASRSMRSNAFQSSNASDKATSDGSSTSTNARQPALGHAHCRQRHPHRPFVIRDCHPIIVTDR